ncbi:MAG: hypothetical protein H6681_06815 [Desulfobacteraceae bacterium]|nr:hypothetical protein [Desulfobacteraceae bacterium]MCB9495134.1 hypothetical protein [Desulfobacteraceae bacterium]
MINSFMDEAVNSGAEAVLPKNLKDKWLDPICEAGAEFLKSAFNEKQEDPETFLNHEKGLLLLAAASELIQSRYDYPAGFHIATLPQDILFEYISCYSLAALLEKGKRESLFEIPDIDEDNIFDQDFISEIEQKNPAVTSYLYSRI